MRVTAVIFDLDGTVISNEDEWGEAFRRVLKKLGVEEKAAYPHVGGIGIRENWPNFIKKYNIKTDKGIEELASETKQEYLKLVPKIRLKKGFKNIVADLRNSGVKVALATSSTWDTVERILDKFQIEELFDSITTGDEVGNKKPNPEIFRVASEKLTVEPEECLVFEDSKAGIEAAKFAGMKVIGVFRNTKHKKELEGADKLIKNFEKVIPRVLSQLGNIVKLR